MFNLLKDNNMILDVECSDEELLAHTGRDILKLIKKGDDSWKTKVPEIAHKAAMHLH